MVRSPYLPTHVRIVAWLFVAIGLLSLAQFFLLLRRSIATWPIGALGLFIGWGLLAGRNGWRIAALVWLWAGIVTLPVQLIAVIFWPGVIAFRFLGQTLAYLEKPAAGLFTVLGFLLCLWQYAVLTCRPVRRRYEGRFVTHRMWAPDGG
ncbi:MAG: hypothetical protein JXR37_31575 [Kiritimatiellae bacterium]|nr:hypothetical protein [Kiritimatiellia bacterium]